jgi:putative membrane protein
MWSETARTASGDGTSSAVGDPVLLRVTLAWLHLLALGVGLGGVWGRARALHDSLREPIDDRAVNSALVADSWWGAAAVVWLVTGLWRLVAGTEKSTSYYLSNHAFFAKMAMFITILALEVWPMITLIRWRTGTREPNPRDIRRIEVISYVECALAVAMVLAAVTMARGFGERVLPTDR